MVLVTPVVCGICLFFLAPPLWINYGIETRWASGTLFSAFSLMRVIDLESSLGAVSWNLAGCILCPFASPRWWRLFHNLLHRSILLREPSRLSCTLSAYPSYILVWKHWLGCKFNSHLLRVLIASPFICTAWGISLPWSLWLLFNARLQRPLPVFFFET